MKARSNWARNLVVIGTLTSATVFAATVTVDLSTYNAASGSTGVWNIGTRSLHVPLVVDRSGGTVSGQENESVTLGTGSDGVFDASTAASFDINAGGTPGLTTLDTSRVYEFSTFTLTTGSTLKGQGTSALKIRVQGDVQIDGTVDLRGVAGGDSIAVAANTNNGGAAGPGGGAGGAGPSAVQTFTTSGTSPTAGGEGLPGTISNAAGTDGGAGGGGANRYSGSPGSTHAFASGTGGTAYGDETLETLVGGAGGGGGAGNSNVGTGGPGGGGGGGALSFEVGGNFVISSTGSILTTGGAGGALANGAHRAGGGGGGGGGSVRIYAGGTGTDNGSIDSTGGAGGTGFVVGGDGGGGVNRFAFSSGDFTGSGSENPPPSLTPKPRTAYTRQTVTITTGTYDTGATNPHYSGLTKTETRTASDTISYELAGSSDAFAADNTGFVSESNLSRLDGKRYFKIRITLKSASSSATPKVTALSVNYQNLFDYSLVGCARVTTAKPGPPTPWGWAILSAYLIAIGVWVRRSRTDR
jgi:hypothetical protein